MTADEILVVNYKGQPDPLQQALVEDAGANTDPDVNNQVEVDYINLLRRRLRDLRPHGPGRDDRGQRGAR